MRTSQKESLVQWSPNNLLLRADFDKVHAPYRHLSIWCSGSAPQVRRAAAEQGRYAATANDLLPNQPQAIV
jgi:hypothetical protein